MPAIIRSSILLVVVVIAGRSEVEAQAVAPQKVALVNGQWFNGRSFEAQTVYSVNGQFTFQKPAAVERILDLAGTWIVPPFGEAHNHNIGTGVEERDLKAI